MNIDALHEKRIVFTVVAFLLVNKTLKLYILLHQIHSL